MSNSGRGCRDRKYARSLNGIFVRAKSRAKYRGISWNISFEEFVELRKKPCHYCKSPLPETGHGLDRLDNGMGYEISNVVPCCAACNMIKGPHLTVEEALIAIQAVNKFRGISNA